MALASKTSAVTGNTEHNRNCRSCGEVLATSEYEDGGNECFERGRYCENENCEYYEIYLEHLPA